MVVSDSRRSVPCKTSMQAPLLHDQHILIADDDNAFVQLAQIALEPISERLDVAYDGADALGLLLQHSYDLAILDLSMPHTDGFRLLSLIRHTPSQRNLPIVVITSRDDSQAAEEVYKLGADLMLVKPINWAVLPYQVSGAIRARKGDADKAQRQAAVEPS